MLIVSPYVKPHVDHTEYQFGSILRFVEQTWNLDRWAGDDADSTSIAMHSTFDVTPDLQEDRRRTTQSFFLHQNAFGQPARHRIGWNAGEVPRVIVVDWLLGPSVDPRRLRRRSAFAAAKRLGIVRACGQLADSNVIIIVQENRSFDNLFAGFPGANGATRGKKKVKQGGKYVDKWQTLQSHSLVMPTDLQHCHKAFETDYDGGKMDGFNLEGKGSCPNGKPAGTLPYQYVSIGDRAVLVIAKQWVLADDMFQSQGSGSFTAHQDLIRGGTCIQGCGKPDSRR